MVISLEGKNALVGGSSRGIGRAIATQLAESGATVTLMARSDDQLKALAKNLPAKSGQRHSYLKVDFTDLEAYRQIIGRYFEENTVDILVNNTQGPAAGNSLELETDDYQHAFDVLFKCVHMTTCLALKHMMHNKWGRIINVASISVKEPLPYLALSNTIRAAVVTWAKTLATDVGSYGITVNTILTGYFDTERISGLNEKKARQLGVPKEEVRTEMELQVPVKRIGKPEEFGFLVAFLASDMAAYLTGSSIPLDGGLLKSM
jgi:3-oxoacyl-[acyl-carrier protein] reductase